ncbi:MAG: hypothetical protein JNG84_07710, partial [Archangium sp.]|nr:hypothetical protein [Archangium sp.]
MLARSSWSVKAQSGGNIPRPLHRSSSLNELLSRRVILVTGKGGVGRSTTAAAIATMGQRAGKRTLLCEIGDDPSDYSPLAKHFGRERFPVEPIEIAEGLRGVMLLARTGQEMFLSSVIHSATIARLALQS